MYDEEDTYANVRQEFHDIDWDVKDITSHQELETSITGTWTEDHYAALYSGNAIKGRDWKSYCYCKIFGKPCSGKCKKESDDPVDGLKAASYLENQHEEKIKLLSERLVAIKAFKQAREKELKQKNRYDAAFSIWPRVSQAGSSTTANRQATPSSGLKPTVRPPPRPPLILGRKPATGLNAISQGQQQLTPPRDSQQRLASDDANQSDAEETQENERSEFDEFADL